MDLSKHEDRKKLFMLCHSTDEKTALQLKDNYYVGQLKRDGERIIAIVLNNKAILINRRGKICNLHFQELVEDLKQLPNCVIDGEVISVDDDFSKLMKRAMTKTPSKLRELQKEIPIRYEVFDVLGVGDNATNKIHLPLKDRIIELENLFFGKVFKHVNLLPNLPIAQVLQQAKDNDGEGIIVKDLNAKYDCGKRSHAWEKLKFFKEVDIIVTKYEENNGGITAETDNGIRVLIAGQQHHEVKDLLDTDGKAEITIQYLSQSETTGKYRFPSYKKLVVK